MKNFDPNQLSQKQIQTLLQNLPEEQIKKVHSEKRKELLNGFNIEQFPSIAQEGAADHTSRSYSFIPTTRVVDVLANNNWFPIKASEISVRDSNKSGFQKHMIRFRNPKLGLQNVVDNLLPEIVLTNSHDGLASFTIQFGIFRVVCTNGMVVANSTFPAHRIKHIGYTDQAVSLQAVSLAIEEICDTAPRIGSRIKEFQGIDLTPDEKGVYAMSALRARYGELKNREFDIERLLLPMRNSDRAPSLWNTFNIVQEKFIKGGRFEKKEVKDWPPGYKKTSKARGINAINENIRVNQALWYLTEEMAKIKGASA